MISGAALVRTGIISNCWEITEILMLAAVAQDKVKRRKAHALEINREDLYPSKATMEFRVASLKA